MTDQKKRGLRILVQIVGIAGLIWIDYLLKQLAAAKLKGGDTVVLLKGVLGLCYAENTGAAFSLFASSTAVLTVVTGVALLGGLAALIFIKKKPLIYEICIPLIIAGGAGNQIDRIKNGYVVDYIRTLFIDFPIFNFADILITCSCIAIIVYLLYEIARDMKKPKPEEEASA